MNPSHLNYLSFISLYFILSFSLSLSLRLILFYKYLSLCVSPIFSCNFILLFRSYFTRPNSSCFDQLLFVPFVISLFLSVYHFPTNFLFTTCLCFSCFFAVFIFLNVPFPIQHFVCFCIVFVYVLFLPILNVLFLFFLLFCILMSARSFQFNDRLDLFLVWKLSS